MNSFFKICKRALFLPVWLAIIIFIISMTVLVAVFVKGIDKSLLAYAVYALSFYSLVTVCVSFIPFLRKNGKNIKYKVKNSKLGTIYVTDPQFKTLFGLYCSLIFNVIYSCINLFSGIYYNTAWFKVYAAYYFIMATMRFLLLKFVNKVGIGNDIIGELKRSRLCAVILLTVNFSLSGAVLMMAYVDKGFVYHGVLIYIMAMYTFGITAAAIIKLVKYRKYSSPVMSMTKVVSFASALVSMLSLETAMLSSFGSDMAVNTKRIFIIATGAGISFVISSVAVGVIIVNGKLIKRMENIKKVCK